MGETRGQKIPWSLGHSESRPTAVWLSGPIPAINRTTQARLKAVAGSRLAHHTWAILLPRRIHSQSPVDLTVQTELLVFNLIVQGAGWE